MAGISKRTCILFLLPITFLYSCKKFLDKAPDTLFAYPTTVDNLQATLEGAVNYYATPSYAESSADDFFVTEAIYNSMDISIRKAYTWDIPQFTSANDWRTSYSFIYIANICISGIDGIARTPANLLAWNNVKGSAYFSRAYYFLHLAWTYANAYNEATAATDLGIVLRKTTDINEPSKRATIKESYDQVISDAKQSVLYLPDLPSHPLRPSKAAGYALLARAYLSMRNYDSAFRYADLSLQLKNDLIDYNGDIDLVSDFNQPQSPFRVFNKETIFYTETSGWVYIFHPNYAFIDTLLYSYYSNNDLRKTAFFSTVGQYNRFKGMYSQNTERMFSGIATDEVLLMRAECAARKGDKNGALVDLNQLLSKRWKTGTFTPLTAGSNVEALNLVLLERRKELLMRCLRWMDIKRLNKGGENINLKRLIGTQAYSLTPNNKAFALPIPNDIIQITGMPQNPR